MYKTLISNLVNGKTHQNKTLSTYQKYKCVVERQKDEDEDEMEKGGDEEGDLILTW